MSNSEETYQVRRSEFTRQEDWIPSLLAPYPALGGFFLQFQSCFGRSAAPRDNEEFKGLFLSQPRMSALMKAEGIAGVERLNIQKNLAKLVELGIVSKAPVADPNHLDTSSKRIVWIYVINKTKPFEFESLVKDLAAKEYAKSKYKGQAKASAAKKAREAAAVTIEEEVPTIITSEAGILAEKKLDERIGVIAEIMCQSFSDQGRAEALVFNYLKKDGNVCDAIKAMKDIKNKQLPLTPTCFEFGLKSHDVFLTREENTWADAARDELNRLRQALKAAEADEHFADVAENFKLQRQVQELEQERIKNTAAIEVKRLSDDEILEAMAASLQDMDI